MSFFKKMAALDCCRSAFVSATLSFVSFFNIRLLSSFFLANVS